MKEETCLLYPLVLAFLLLVLLVGMVTSYAVLGELSWMMFTDYLSLVFVLGCGFGLTLSRFTIREQLTNFTTLFRRKSTKQDWVRMYYYWQCVIRNLLVVGAAGSFIGNVLMLQNLSEPKVIAPSMAVMMLTSLYGVVLSLLVPVPALVICKLRITSLSLKMTQLSWEKSFSRKAGFILAGVLIYLAMISGGSFWAFVDIPSTTIVFGLSIGVVLVFYGWRIIGIIVCVLFYVFAVLQVSPWTNFHTIVTGFLLILSINFLKGIISKSGRLRKMPLGELLTVTFTLTALIGGLVGIFNIGINYDNPMEVGPNMAVVLLTGFYALLGLMFVSYPMEDRFNLTKGIVNDLALSHLCWFVFPFLTCAMAMAAHLGLLFSMSNVHVEFMKLGTESQVLSEAFLLVAAWLVTFSVFLAGFGVAQFLLLVYSNDQLRRTQEQLVKAEKMASLGQLVGGVAHEINNPINFIQSNIPPLSEYIQGFKNIIQGLDSNKNQWPDSLKSTFDDLYRQNEIDYAMEDSVKLLHSFDEGSRRIAHIVDDLRQFSRTDKDFYSPYDIREAIGASLSLLENNYKQRITIHTDYADIPKIKCSPGKIDQVVMNLLANAIDAIDGEGSIRIETRQIRDRVVVTIRDDGRGIPEEHLVRIFDPFFTTKPVGAGTGLGLSIAHTIVEQHGGTISVESEEGKGSVFTLSLPIQQTDIAR